jgi:hypothetical protein
VTRSKEVGRPRILNATKRSEICAILAVGCSRATAAQYVGCHPDTIRNTAQRDPEFAAALEQAESRHELKHLALINKAAEEGKYWRAAAWALERKYPGRYGRRHPDMFTVEQVSHVLAQFAFAGVILEEVPEDGQRGRILARLSELTLRLETAGAEGAEE